MYLHLTGCRNSDRPSVGLACYSIKDGPSFLFARSDTRGTKAFQNRRGIGLSSVILDATAMLYLPL